MGIKVKWNGDQKFLGVSDDGVEINISPGVPHTLQPPELLLMSLGSCIGFFILPESQKLGIEVEDFEIDIQGEKSTEPPKLFDAINVNVKIKGNLTDAQCSEMLENIHEKCFIMHSLNPNIEINTTHEITNLVYS